MKGLLGSILLAIGILIAGATGLCSLLVLGNGSPGAIVSAIPTVLLFAAIAGAIGAGLIYAGRRLIRLDREER